MKVALITGITGQDGSYLAELLLEKGYEVHGIVRRASLINTYRIDHIFDKINLHYGDLTDSANIIHILQKIKPDENGLVQEIPQTETTPFYPRSPYGCAKVYAYWLTKNYREAYGMYACTGILFNHESPRRGETFVTRKIVRGLSRISVGEQKVLYLGNLDAKRDWGHAKDYVKAMWLMLQQEVPDDYVIATGKQYSVREFVEKVAPYFGMTIEWYGSGDDEIGIDKVTKKTIIAVNSKYYRPAEVETLLGDSTKAKEQLGWEPEISFDQLVEDMCIHGQ